MPQRKSFGQQRMSSLGSWATTQSIPGLDQKTYDSIFEYIRSSQSLSGAWEQPGNNWGVVMTAVVLRALDRIGFSESDEWRTSSGQGGISQAINYLVRQISEKNPEEIPEDPWDACQAVLALQRHQLPEARRIAESVNSNWRTLFESPRNRNRWLGPAYLAAIVDVLTALDDGSNSWQLREALKALIESEAKGNEGGLGVFPAKNGQTNMNRWNTSLVVRTLCTVRPKYRDIVDPKLIERVCAWLLKEIDHDGWGDEIAEEPMFYARAMAGLYEARRWVGEPLSTRIDEAAIRINQKLYSIWHTEPRHGNLKAYTAVAEYLALWTVPAPAGLLFDAAAVFESTLAQRGIPLDVPDGLRIAWLSDLHVEQDKDQQPYQLSQGFIKQTVHGLMHYRGTPITAHFQAQNLSTILRRVEEINPDHILVSGDVTNYALKTQFEAVRERFLEVQGAIRTRQGRELKQGGLDPVLWTILPGNHDVTDEEAMSDANVRCNLGMLEKSLKTWDANVPLDEAFPIHKQIVKNGSLLGLHLIGLDSTRKEPVWVVGFNALGRIDRDQFGRLDTMLQSRGDHEMWLVVLHHHPIVVPDLLPKLQDEFLSLNDSDGKALIRRCIQNGVSAILHGHFHRFSSWSGMVPDGKRYMWIIGSPAGTLTVPGYGEQFLELREAKREQTSGEELGLAIYAHRNTAGVWSTEYTGIFVPSP